MNAKSNPQGVWCLANRNKECSWAAVPRALRRGLRCYWGAEKGEWGAGKVTSAPASEMLSFYLLYHTLRICVHHFVNSFYVKKKIPKITATYLSYFQASQRWNQDVWNNDSKQWEEWSLFFSSLDKTTVTWLMSHAVCTGADYELSIFRLTAHSQRSASQEGKWQLLTWAKQPWQQGGRSWARTWHWAVSETRKLLMDGSSLLPDTVENKRPGQ